MTERTYEVTATPAVTTGIQQVQKTAELAIAQPPKPEPHVVTPATGVVHGVNRAILESQPFNAPPLPLPLVDNTTSAGSHPDAVEQTTTAPTIQEESDNSSVGTLTEDPILSAAQLFTHRQYPCGCEASGAGDVPAYCGTHGIAPIAIPMVNFSKGAMIELLDAWFEENFHVNKLRAVERQEWKNHERDRVLEAVNRLKAQLGL